MTKKSKIIVGITVLLFIACGLAWWFMSIHFLRGVEPEDIVMIKVLNGNNGDEFEITNPDDISDVVYAIKQITFKKEDFASEEVSYWYRLTFINENGEEVESLAVQNPRILQKNITQKGVAFYRCDGELSVVGDYLESLEAARFPDYNRDPDFSDY